MTASYQARASSAIKERPPTILLVEDDPATRQLLQLVLSEDEAYQVISHPSDLATLEAIDELRRLKPDLFLLDFQLPSMTATQLYDHLHALEEFRDTPALVMTAYTGKRISQQLVERNIQLIEKPFDLEDLLRSIEQLLR